MFEPAEAPLVKGEGDRLGESETFRHQGRQQVHQVLHY